MSTTIAWTTFCNPSTLVNIGSEAVAMLCDNIICCTHLKTEAISYYKAESPALGLSISCLAGHNRLPMLAFCEVVLRPFIHILQYPQMTKYAVYAPDEVVCYVDLRFSEYDILIAMTGQPQYSFRIWNFRTGDLLVKHDTNRQTDANSLLCSFQLTPTIGQYCRRERVILFWQMCYSATGTDLHEISRIPLTKEFALVTLSSMCYTDDNAVYIVNDYGDISLIEVAQFQMKRLWTSPVATRGSLKPLPHSLYYNKQGLLWSSRDQVCFLRRKHVSLELVWQISGQPSGDIIKMVSNQNGEIYAAAAIGNLYRVSEAPEATTLVGVHTLNVNNIDFAILRGLREEVIVQLTTAQVLRAAEMAHMRILSSLPVEHATSLAAHNSGPYVAVGTSDGKVHFVSYEKVRAPVPLAVVETASPYAISAIQWVDHVAVYRNDYFSFFWVRADWSVGRFLEVGPFDVGSLDGVHVLRFFLAEQNRVFLLFNRSADCRYPHADALWYYDWRPDEAMMARLEFQMPHTYRDVALANWTPKSIVELFGARREDNVIDFYHFRVESGELVLTGSVRTRHLSNINGAVAARNLLTWGVDGTILHFRKHKKSPKPFMVSQTLQVKYRPRVVKQVVDCFNAKYMVHMYHKGGIKVMRTPLSTEGVSENVLLSDGVEVIGAKDAVMSCSDQVAEKVVVQHTAAELEAHEQLCHKVEEFGRQVSALIDYDISVTGRTRGVFRKFCLNSQWLDMVQEEARRLCRVERRSLQESVADQQRIRDWIYNLVMATTSAVSFRVRAAFSNSCVENYGRRLREDFFTRLYDLYRFHDLEPLEEEEQEGPERMAVKPFEDAEEGAGSSAVNPRRRKFFAIEGSAYDHLMSDELAMQDIDLVTGHQMCAQNAKFKILIGDRLKEEFNKQFEETRRLKQDMLDSIAGCNEALRKIYSNMNIMLRLLKLSPFVPPVLSMPEWSKDEILKRIMEVDDSEIKAINRRKKKEQLATHRGGRMLLWSSDFWTRALVTMMDGVIEKLWEEEIKKDIPPPEFMAKKDVHEYTLEDQKMLRDYEERVRLLTEDRRKYLRILTENEALTTAQKRNYILKLNERITEMMILKLKYDFAGMHCTLRCRNAETAYFHRQQWRRRMTVLRSDIAKIDEYVSSFAKLSEYSEKAVNDLRAKLETLSARGSAVDRQFKNQYLNAIPQHLTAEMGRLFKRRPKMAQKLLNSSMMCNEMAARVNAKGQQTRYPFPLPKDFHEYLEALNELDDAQNSPGQMEAKHWDAFVKLRRQKIESELKVRATSLRLADAQGVMTSNARELSSLRDTRVADSQQLQDASEQYLHMVLDQSLEMRLTMGQVEVDLMGSMRHLSRCVLMHEDDINDVNALILRAGQKKLKAMQRVAFFRRQVIFKEWEHKVVSANIEYLRYMLHVVEKCKVSMEFLQILRNWTKVRSQRQQVVNSVGILERAVEEKLLSFRRNLERLNRKIDNVRAQIDQMKRANQRINKQIDDVKVVVAIAATNRDTMIEEKRQREQNERMQKIYQRSRLMDSIRSDHAKISELSTILELLRLRTYPTLGPAPPQCP